MKLIFCAAALLCAWMIVDAEPGSATKNDNLRAKPFIDGKIVAPLKKGAVLDIQKREGSWYFVKAGAKTGYVPMLSVHRTQPAAAVTKGSLSSTASGRSATGGVVSTTGVRGISEENLKSAAFSDSAIAAAEKYRVSLADADSFARAGGLKARSVPSLSTTAQKGGNK
jgi:hypothetical protein